MVSLKGKIMSKQELGEGFYYISFEEEKDTFLSTPQFAASWGAVMKEDRAKEFDVGKEFVCEISVKE